MGEGWTEEIQLSQESHRTLKRWSALVGNTQLHFSLAPNVWTIINLVYIQFLQIEHGSQTKLHLIRSPWGFKKSNVNRALVAHACNSSYLGDRDQEDCGSKPAQANSSWDPISKKKTHHKKRTGGVAQRVSPELKPQHHKKRQRKKEKVI
jgi:hypothetical protein